MFIALGKFSNKIKRPELWIVLCAYNNESWLLQAAKLLCKGRKACIG